VSSDQDNLENSSFLKRAKRAVPKPLQPLISMRGAIIALSVLIMSYAVHIGLLFNQLETAFLGVEESTPTKIYSDVSRFAPATSRKYVEARLKALGYAATFHEDSITVYLHAPDYPYYLVPEEFGNLNLGGKAIELVFDGSDKNALLQSIQADENELASEIPELYLEPELVATLSRGTPGDIRQLIKFQNIPKKITDAVIAIEDQHFRTHKGLDPRGFFRAIWVNLKSFSFRQGGSTLTQQLVKNLMARRSKNIFKKFNEIFLSFLLEMRFEKEEILARYLNEVYLGQIGNLEIHGVLEGAQYFFGKELEKLSLPEAAMMAGLIRGPSYYSPYRHWERAYSRMELVLQKMVETGRIAEQEAMEAKEIPIELKPPTKAVNRAPYFTDFVKAELISALSDQLSEQEIIDSGLRVYTTLDVEMNRAAQQVVNAGVESLNEPLADLKLKGALFEGALASADPRNGYIRTLIGGHDYQKTTFNRILNMKRQVGSTFKPIVYMAAFDKKMDSLGTPFGAAYPVQDAPWKLTYDNQRQEWEPKNYKKEFRGWISIREALAHSINIVAAKVGIEAGLSRVIDMAKALGVTSELPKVPSLALGSTELSPIELLNVYATIANHGNRDELTVIRGITDDQGKGYRRFVYHPKEVVDPALTDIMTDLLQDIFLYGTARSATHLGFVRPAAGKTGTTNDHRDAWFAGFTPQLVTVVWVGLESGSLEASIQGATPGKIKNSQPEASNLEIEKLLKKLPKLTGGGSALPLWVSYMKEALENTPPEPFPISNFLTNVQIDKYTGKRAENDCPDDQIIVEKVIKGSQIQEQTCASGWPETVAETIAN
jgi:1A family penicillin-binding protein